MTNGARSSALELIRANIARFGHHVYLVSGGPSPRFAYTIGISPVIGAELILAGASFYSAEDAKVIVNKIAAILRTKAAWQRLSVDLDSLGSFSFREVDPSWSNSLILGALDFYGANEIPALQIVPDDARRTVDVPDLARPWAKITEPIWQWLHEPWMYAVPAQSVATTNLSALRGERVTEAARWEEGQWELFAGAGPDVAHEDVRVVPLGTLLAADQSLNAVADLRVGEALWRDSTELEWHPWSRSAS